MVTIEQLRAEGKEDLAQRVEARSTEEQMADAVMKLKRILIIRGLIQLKITLLLINNVVFITNIVTFIPKNIVRH